MRTVIKHPLTFLVNDADVSGPVTITAGTRPGEYAFTLADSSGRAVVTSSSGKALARYAFDHGADSVRHAYDCGLEPEL